MTIKHDKLTLKPHFWVEKSETDPRLPPAKWFHASVYWRILVLTCFGFSWFGLLSVLGNFSICIDYSHDPASIQCKNIFVWSRSPPRPTHFSGHTRMPRCHYSNIQILSRINDHHPVWGGLTQFTSTSGMCGVSLLMLTLFFWLYVQQWRFHSWRLSAKVCQFTYWDLTLLIVLQ